MVGWSINKEEAPPGKRLSCSGNDSGSDLIVSICDFISSISVVVNTSGVINNPLNQK